MAEAIEVRILGLTELRARLTSLSPAVRDKLRVFMARQTIDLKEQVQQNILFRFRSQGPLYQGVKSAIAEDVGGFTGRVYIDDVPYADIQERGGTTSAHDIVPVNGVALAFMAPGRMGFSGGPKGSEMVFAKKVHHPGSKIPERSYARLALQQLRRPFEDGIREVVNEAVAATVGAGMVAA